jgi:hypothetical protein
LEKSLFCMSRACGTTSGCKLRRVPLNTQVTRIAAVEFINGRKCFSIFGALNRWAGRIRALDSRRRRSRGRYQRPQVKA